MARPISGQTSVQDLVRGLVSGESAMTRGEVARELQRDPRMVSKILRGETSGESYRKAITELSVRGTVTTPPPRRRRTDGRLVQVRASKDSGARLTIPPRPTSGSYTDVKQGGRWSTKTSYMPKGGRLHEVKLPKGAAAIGRRSAAAEIERLARSAAKSQSWGDKNVKFTLTFANGRTMEVGSKGGYGASSFLRQVNEFKASDRGDAIAWLLSQSDERYTDLDLAKVPITAVQVQVYANLAAGPKR